MKENIKKLKRNIRWNEMTTSEEIEHSKHISGGYFKMGCKMCERFIGKYFMSGRKFKIGKVD